MSGMILTSGRYLRDYLDRPEYFGIVYRGQNAKLQNYLANPEQAALVNLPISTNGNQTLLHVAAYGNADAQTVGLLLKANADLIFEDTAGRVPFSIAANAGDPAIVEAFLKSPLVRQLLFSHPDKNDRTPLHAICMPGSSIKEKRRGADLAASFVLILKAYQPENVIFALHRNDKFGISPIRYAKHFGYTEILDVYAEMGYDIEAIPAIDPHSPALAEDYWGRPSCGLMTAAFDNDYATVDKILSSPNPSNDPNTPNKQFGNRNAFHYAVCGGSDKVVYRFLQDPRTNVNAVAVNGSTALHFAGSRGHAPVMQVMLANADIRNNVNVKDTAGNTALHALAMNKIDDSTRLQTLELLVAAGIDVHAVNADGLNALDVARLRGNDKVADKLATVMMDQYMPSCGCLGALNIGERVINAARSVKSLMFSSTTRHASARVNPQVDPTMPLLEKKSPDKDPELSKLVKPMLRRLIAGHF